MKNIIDKLIQFYRNNREIVSLIIKYVVIAIAAIILIRILCNPPVPEPVITTNIEEVETLQDRNGKLVAKIEQQNLEIAKNNKLIDSLGYVLKVKPKFIKGVDREVTRIDTVWRDSVVYAPFKDSSVIYMQDPWVYIKAVGKPKGSYIDFKLTPDTLTRVGVTRNPLFGRPITDNYLIHSNPYFKTTHGDSYQEKQKRAIANLSLSIGYDPFQKRWFGGPTIGVPIKTFYSKK